jgi:hypothetical protein
MFYNINPKDMSKILFTQFQSDNVHVRAHSPSILTSFQSHTCLLISSMLSEVSFPLSLNIFFKLEYSCVKLFSLLEPKFKLFLEKLSNMTVTIVIHLL